MTPPLLFTNPHVVPNPYFGNHWSIEEIIMAVIFVLRGSAAFQTIMNLFWKL